MNTNNNPLVTAMIPSYNHAKYIKEAIQSIIDQDYKNIEFIIIDDGSSDNSVEIIKSMIPECEKRFKRFEFRSRENKGVSATLNEAIEWSKGKYFSPLASDDIALPYRVSFLLEKIKASNYPAVFGDIKRIGEVNDKDKNFENATLHTFDEIFTFKRPMPASCLYQTKKLKDIGGYPADIAVEDWYIELKLTENGEKIISYPEVLTYYRRHQNNTSKNYELLYQSSIQITNFYKDHYLYDKVIRICHMYIIRNSLNNNSHSPIFNNLINSLEKQIKELVSKNKNIIIYGTGTIYDLIQKYLPKNIIVLNKDNIYKINNIDFDIILISAIGYEDEIIKNLMVNYNINKNKIKQFEF